MLWIYFYIYLLIIVTNKGKDVRKSEREFEERVRKIDKEWNGLSVKRIRS